MLIHDVQRSSSSQMGPAGLALIGEMARISGLDNLAKQSMAKQPNITYPEILRTLCGLLCQGKTDFDQVKGYQNDQFFQAALGLDRVPSAEILRQRFKELSLETELGDKLPECSLALWQQTEMEPEYIISGERRWVRMDIDTVIYDNEDTKKEGAGFAYNGQFGFNPLFAHLGGGWMVNAKLRPGNAHCLAEGTRDFIHQSLELGRTMVRDPLLLVADSGFDSQDVIKSLVQAENTDLIIKHNQRGEKDQAWLKTAKENASEEPEELHKRRKTQTVYRGSIYKEVDGLAEPVRLVFEVTETTKKKGRPLLYPDITVFSAWTTLDLPEREILRIYRDRGTSEQYHAELKTEMDMERLPSGNFKVNSTFLRLGMLVYNMLKVLGRDMVLSKALGLKKATRRRMKTVMRSLILMCGKIVKHARRIELHLDCPNPWYKLFKQLFVRLKAA